MNSKQRGILCSNLLHLFFCKVFHFFTQFSFFLLLFSDLQFKTWVLVPSFSRSPVHPEHSPCGSKLPCHALFKGTHVNYGVCQEGDSSGCSFSWISDGLNAPVNHYKPWLLPPGHPDSLLLPSSNPDSIHSCSWGRSTHRGMCSHRQDTCSTEVLMEAATRFLLPFLVHAIQQDLQADSLTLKLVNLPQLLYLITGKSSIMERFTHTV